MRKQSVWVGEESEWTTGRREYSEKQLRDIEWECTEISGPEYRKIVEWEIGKK